MQIRVPATSANLGPGFDAMGMAVSMANTLTVEENEDFSMTGQPAGITRLEDNLIYRTMLDTWKMLGRSPRSVSLHQQDQIPSARGLGSSAACIVAGITAVNLLEKRPLSLKDCVNLSAQIEGHADNALPAWLGGICAGVLERGKVSWVRVDPPQRLTCVAFIPDHPLSTAKARAVLPREIPRADGVFNTGHAALLMGALATGQLEHLSVAVQDRLHQGYRAGLIPDYFVLERVAREAGAQAVFLSGAGPTIMGWWVDDLPDMEMLKPRLQKLVWGWDPRVVSIAREGMVVEEDHKTD